MRYFEKTAVGPAVVFDVDTPAVKENSFAVYYSADEAHQRNLNKKWKHLAKKNKGIIFINKNEFLREAKKDKKYWKTLKNPPTAKEAKKLIKKLDQKAIKRLVTHELVHHIRGKKNIFTDKYYGIIPGARTIEETAAYGREQGSKLKGFKDAVIRSPIIRDLTRLIKKIR